MGHKRIETTMRYAHLAPKHLEELADVLANYNEPKEPAPPPQALAA